MRPCKRVIIQCERCMRSERTCCSTIFNTIQEPICVVDSERRILTANPAFQALSGSSKWELLSRNVADAVAPLSLEGMVVLENVTASVPRELETTQRLESLGIIASGVAHDVINLISAISTGISVARLCSEQGQDITAVLDNMEASCAKATAVTKQVLSVAKSKETTTRAVSIATMLRTSARLVLSGSNCRESFSMPEHTWPVRIDVDLLGQVFRNLIINADQAMPQGGVIDIRAENIEIDESEPAPLAPGRYVRISISDQGIGIPEDHLDRIFDLFFTTKQRGSGLGLPVARSIMQRYHGHISVASQPGVGTTAHLHFRADNQAPVEMNAKPTDKILPGGGRILVMDDQRMVRKQMSIALGKLGCEVTVAEDGTEAVALYEEVRRAGIPFDLVFLDLQVPGGMGGEETLKRLQDLDSGVRAIVFSAHFTSTAYLQHKENGFVGALAKPYTLDALSRIVRQHGACRER